MLSHKAAGKTDEISYESVVNSIANDSRQCKITHRGLFDRAAAVVVNEARHINLSRHLLEPDINAVSSFV